MERSAYRFSIQDVLWLVLVLGLALGWWRESRRGVEALQWRAKAQILARELVEHGYAVEISNDSVEVRDQDGNSIFQLD